MVVGSLTAATILVVFVICHPGHSGSHHDHLHAPPPCIGSRLLHCLHLPLSQFEDWCRGPDPRRERLLISISHFWTWGLVLHCHQLVFGVFSFYLFCPHLPKLSQNKIKTTFTNFFCFMLFDPPPVSRGCTIWLYLHLFLNKEDVCLHTLLGSRSAV